jgi:hypothetical protein
MFDYLGARDVDMSQDNERMNEGKNKSCKYIETH